MAGTGVPDTDNIIMLVIIFPHFIECLKAFMRKWKPSEALIVDR